MSVQFSVLVPVYNVKSYVEECINSVVNQTFRDFELILVDDGSTDGSGDICDLYKNKYPYIKVFHKHNEGLIATRQFAIKKATGQYFIFLDSDDWIEANALDVINKAFKLYHCDCVVYGYNRILNGKVVYTTHGENINYLESKRQIYKKCFSDTSYNSLCRKAVKSSIVSDKDYSSYYHLSHAEDLLQSITIYKESNIIVFLEEKLYNYRVNPKSITQNIDYNLYKPDYTIRKTVLSFLVSEHVFSEEDFLEYKKVCLKMMLDEIIGIASSSVSIDKKMEILNLIVKDEYFENFIASSKYVDEKDRVYKIIRRISTGKYLSLLCYGYIKLSFRRIISLFRCSRHQNY